MRNPWSSSLPEETRRLIGQIHPRFMGGEYLPDLGDKKVEIARITLASTTQDVISIRAQRSGSRIRYSIRDEYEDMWDEFPYKCSPEHSDKPLSMRQLIQLISDASPGGIPAWHRDGNLACDGEPEDFVNFVRVTSAFYPQLERYYAEEAQEWLARHVAEREAEWQEAERQEQEEQRRREAENEAVRTVGPRSPLDFPPGTHVHQLGPVDRAALQKWMREVAGLANATIIRRPSKLLRSAYHSLPSNWLEIKWSVDDEEHCLDFSEQD